MFAVTRDRETAISSDFASAITMGAVDLRVICALLGSFGFPAGRWPALVLVALIVLPIAGGLRLNVRRRESLLIVAGVLAALALAPLYAWSTNWLYQRFVLFLLPAYAWQFDDEAPRTRLAQMIAPGVRLAAIAIVGCVLALHVVEAIRFSRETRDFGVVLARAAPGQRALSLPLDVRSATDPNWWTYLHFALWYQADKQGLVDFNFADLHPQIVRFSGPRAPLYQDRQFGLANLNWRRDDAGHYRYFFVRSAGPVPPGLFAGADCAPVQIAASGTWLLFERQPCLRGPR
jgi:hypothetical protein